MRKHSLLKTFVLLNTLAVGGIYLINRSIDSSVFSRRSTLKKDAGKAFNWAHGDIFYQVSGEGSKPILLVHDLNAYSSSYEWEALVKHLEKDHLVFTLDLLGCGRSDKPAITYTNYLYVQLINSFIEEIIGEKTEVVASGFSGSFVTMAAFAKPDLYERVTMINPVALKKLATVPDKRSKMLHTLISVPVIGTALYNMFMNRERLDYLLEEELVYNPFSVQGKMVERMYEAAHTQKDAGKHLLASLDGGYMNWDIRRALAGLKVPVSIIYGDRVAKEEMIAASYRSLNHEASISCIHAAKKLPHLEKAEEVAALIG